MAITINNLIGGSINIVTGGTSERWVEPQYTNDWVWADGDRYNPFDSEGNPSGNGPNNGQSDSLPYCETASGQDVSTGIMMQSTYNDNNTSDKCVLIIYWKTNPDNENEPIAIPGYRKYTPGHWEDADGNWINGSWSAWKGGLSDWIKWSNDLVPPAWCNSVEPSTNVECYPSKNDKNANLFIEHDSNSYATRNWNNTKPVA